VDPLQLVQALAIHWKDFRAGVLKELGGRQIYLPGEVSFLHFCRFCSEILKWLNENTRGINNG